MIKKWSLVGKILHAIGGLILRTTARVRIDGKQILVGRGSFILAPNHLSDMDGPLLFLLSPRPATFFINGSHYDLPVLNWLFRHLRFIPVYKQKKNGNAISCGVDALRSGLSVVIFPEGRRSRRGELLRFRKGVAVLAKETGCPVIPVSIQGTERAMPPGSLWIPRRSNLSVRFGRPLYIENTESVEEFSERIRQKVWQLGDRKSAFVPLENFKTIECRLTSHPCHQGQSILG